MGFFDVEYYDSGEGPPPSLTAPHGVLPGLLDVSLVMHQTSTVAVVLGPLTVWPTGLDLTLAAVAREPGTAFLRALQPDAYAEAGRAWPPPELLRFGVEYADGRRVANLREPMALARSGLSLFTRLGTGGSGGFRTNYWLSPLPPEGPVTVACEWPEYDIPETRIELQASDILAAAGRAQGLWDRTG